MDWIAKKKEILDKVYMLAQAKEKEMKKASKEAQDRANEAEGAMKSRYDTFKEEAQYLAGGLKIRHEELKSAVSTVRQIIESGHFEKHDKVRLYSIVHVEFDDGKETKFFLVPVLGGEKLDDDLTLISPSSPVGKELMGKEEGYWFEYLVGNNKKQGEIVLVA